MVDRDIEIGIIIDSRTYDLLAYRTDMGTWEAVATDIDSAVATPAIEWGAEGDYHSAADALAALAAAVVRRAVPRMTAFNWDAPVTDMESYSDELRRDDTEEGDDGAL